MHGRSGCADRVGSHRPLDVLQLLLAQIAEGEVELARGVLAYPRRNANATGLGQAFEPGGDVDPSPKMSPTLMPIRNSMRLSAGSGALLSAAAAWISAAQRKASTTLANSTSKPPPVVLTMRP